VLKNALPIFILGVYENMNNIKQITNFDLVDAPEVTRTVIAGGDTGHTREVTYKIISQNLLGNEITKFGYCVEPKAIQYPIFLTIDGTEKEFQIGKTGMFEVQPDSYKDVNSEDPEEQEEREYEIFIEEIKVPWKFDEAGDPYNGYNFTFDFISPIN